MARLFIPGPTDVDPEVLHAQNQPLISHRSPEFGDLIGRIQPKLRKVFNTNSRVLITASSGTGLQEAAARNGVSERLLVCVCGAFGERWYNVAESNGGQVDRLDSPWGEPNLPEQIVEALKMKTYDGLAVVHNETSTGVENPLKEIAAEVRRHFPDIILMVDAVSSAGGVELQVDGWDLDIVFTSSQKCFALPPGLAFAAVSDRALEKAARIPHRGWYFDFLLLDRYLKDNLTPATPALTLLYALDRQLDRMMAEGLSQRYSRHKAMANQVQEWVESRFDLFAAPKYRSKTVTAIRNTLSLRFEELNAYLSTNEMSIANGYGKLKDITFRIGHMGEISRTDVKKLLAEFDSFLSRPE